METWESWRCRLFIYANGVNSKRVRKCVSEMEREISLYLDSENGK